MFSDMENLKLGVKFKFESKSGLRWVILLSVSITVKRFNPNNNFKLHGFLIMIA